MRGDAISSGLCVAPVLLVQKRSSGAAEELLLLERGHASGDEREICALSRDFLRVGDCGMQSKMHQKLILVK